MKSLALAACLALLASTALAGTMSGVPGTLDVTVVQDPANPSNTGLPTVGNVASGGADTGAPVKVGCVQNTTRPTLSNGQRGDCQMDTRGNVGVFLTIPNSPTALGGAVPAAATAAPNALNTVAFDMATNGTTFDPMRNILGAVAAGNVGTGTLAVEEAGRKSTNITTATTVTAKSGAGFLHTLNIGTEVASATVQCWDNTAASGTSLFKITLPSTVGDFATKTYDLTFATGLTCTTSGLTDVTLTWR